MPQFGLYLLGSEPPPVEWECRWVRWPDFWVPSDRVAAFAALYEAWQRATSERVEVACAGGTGRTGTALACLAVLDGMSASDAVAYVRANYRRRAVETLWQRRFVTHLHNGPKWRNRVRSPGWTYSTVAARGAITTTSTAAFCAT